MRRRQLLKMGFFGGLVMAGGAVLVKGVSRDSPGPKAMWLAVARSVLKDAWPEGRAGEVALEAHWHRLEATLAGLSPATQAEVLELTRILASPLGRWALMGMSQTWEKASVQEVNAGLESLRRSRLLTKQQIFRALRDLTNAAFFADESSWGVLAYPGPLLVEVI
jgi:hypothetical protein